MFAILLQRSCMGYEDTIKYPTFNPTTPTTHDHVGLVSLPIASPLHLISAEECSSIAISSIHKGNVAMPHYSYFSPHKWQFYTVKTRYLVALLATTVVPL